MRLNKRLGVISEVDSTKLLVGVYHQPLGSHVGCHVVDPNISLNFVNKIIRYNMKNLFDQTKHFTNKLELTCIINELLVNINIVTQLLAYTRLFK